MPQVGTYSDLISKYKGKYPDYTPHHVAPKGLANWIGNKLDDDDFQEKIKGKNTPYTDAVTVADRLISEHDNGGLNLPCILIHKNTHIIKSDDFEANDFRVHHGKKTAELIADILRTKNIVPIIKGGEVIGPDDPDFKEFNENEKLGGKDEIEKGKASTQFYQKELEAARKEVYEAIGNELDNYVNSIIKISNTAFHQSFAAVQVALANSVGKDGTREKQNAELTKLNNLAKTKWKEKAGKYINFN